MNDTYFKQPNPNAAAQIARATFKQDPVNVTRFTAGLDNYVYKVEFKDRDPVVVRLNTIGKQDKYKAALYWYNQLRAISIPIPRVYASNTIENTLPFIVMEYCDGKDLGEVYNTLTLIDKQTLATKIAAIQSEVANNLDSGPGFGFAETYEQTNLHRSWVSVLNAHLDRSKKWIQEEGLADPEIVERLRKGLDKFDDYFSEVKPVPFLHDTTTKNVLVNKAHIIGVVDIDSVCFGDPLFVVALTNMALLSMEAKTEYIDFWCEEIHITPEQKAVLRFYTSMFCVNFMGEVGKNFNKQAEELPGKEANRERIKKLQGILRELE